MIRRTLGSLWFWVAVLFVALGCKWWLAIQIAERIPTTRLDRPAAVESNR